MSPPFRESSFCFESRIKRRKDIHNPAEAGQEVWPGRVNQAGGFQPFFPQADIPEKILEFFGLFKKIKAHRVKNSLYIYSFGRVYSGPGKGYVREKILFFRREENPEKRARGGRWLISLWKPPAADGSADQGRSTRMEETLRQELDIEIGDPIIVSIPYKDQGLGRTKQPRIGV
jgi:hypothetical protein